MLGSNREAAKRSAKCNEQSAKSHEQSPKNQKGSILLTGKKLLIADDSVAIQKVIDLTFSDEGMEVTAVGDGVQARDRLEEIAPDIVFADALMPGIDGYELCRIIRQNERLREIPIILLVGSFEPFDEAKARQAGASDIVTKPFQSIRELVSRVGSLLGKRSVEAGSAERYSTLGLGRTDEAVSTASTEDQTKEPDLKVFVEAPSMNSEAMNETNVNVMVEAAPIPEYEHAESAGASCATDVELQTADTRQLERIDNESFGVTTQPHSTASENGTIEIEPVRETHAARNVAETSSGHEVELTQPGAPPPASADLSNDTLLDLEFDSAAAEAVDEDVVLDLDFEAPSPTAEAWPESVVGSLSTPANGSSNQLTTSGVGVAEGVAETRQWEVAPPPVNDVSPIVVEAEAATPADLSPETIDEIARRVVEQMSDRVVREIAWEVVPDLAELLIRERLDKQK
jgi:CheY-like chemotaxis protein